MHRFCAFFLLLFQTFFASAQDHAVVFVHIGKELPSYLKTAVAQARLFNPETPIYVIANLEAYQDKLNQFGKDHPLFVACESLVESPYHKQFNRFSQLDKNYRAGFWQYAMERFFYLDELMSQHDLQNVFHMETDNMIYVNLKEMLPAFRKHYQGIGATFDNNDRCIPGFLYIKNPKVMKKLAGFIANRAEYGETDMQVIANFKKVHGLTMIDHLPIISRKYTEAYPLISSLGHSVGEKDKAAYYNHIDVFQSLFDAAAIGQYLGGTDPRNNAGGPGFINESCIFNVSKLNFEWISDEQGRQVPYAVFEGERLRINNLHIHCKDLEKFFSL